MPNFIKLSELFKSKEYWGFAAVIMMQMIKITHVIMALEYVGVGIDDICKNEGGLSQKFLTSPYGSMSLRLHFSILRFTSGKINTGKLFFDDLYSHLMSDVEILLWPQHVDQSGSSIRKCHSPCCYSDNRRKKKSPSQLAIKTIIPA